MNATASGRPAPPLARVAARATVAWVVLALGGIANGGFRQALLTPTLGEPVARAISIVLLLAIIVAVSAVFVRRYGQGLSTRALLGVGAAWALGSALFEFGLGRLVFDMPWSELLAAYDLLAGEFWVLAPITMLLAPALAGRLGGRRG